MKPPTMSDLAGARVLVVGLGRAGSAAARFLVRAGARVTAYDDRAGAGPAGHPVTRSPGRLAAFSLAVVSPGIPQSHPVLRRLRAARVPVVDELDLASTFLSGSLFAVTGTNGKSTTAALIAAMLRAAGRRTFLGGNIAPGRPLSAAVGGQARDCYVVEVSSFQLERARWLRPDVALLLNITPDHFDRHRRPVAYARCKYRLFARQRPGDRAVLNLDDPLVLPAAQVGFAGREFFTLAPREADAGVRRGWLVAHGRRILPAREVRLRGRHNLANALAACCAVLPAGVEPEAAARVLRGFAGLPHRLEFVRSVAGVAYINNSMCTNPAAGIHSLEAVRAEAGKPVLITGGRGKRLPHGEYLDAVARLARWAVLTGENAPALAAELVERGWNRHEVCPELADAVRAADRRARALTGNSARPVAVLYSPAFASFDQFADFQDRGRSFRREVARLRR